MLTPQEAQTRAREVRARLIAEYDAQAAQREAQKQERWRKTMEALRERAELLIQAAVEKGEFKTKLSIAAYDERGGSSFEAGALFDLEKELSANGWTTKLASERDAESAGSTVWRVLHISWELAPVEAL